MQAHTVFTWAGIQLDALLSTYVLGVVTALKAGLAPIALSCMTPWVALCGWVVLRSEVSETLHVFMWKVFKVSLGLAVALQSRFYTSHVAETANSLALGVASTFLPAAVDPATVTPAHAILDKFNDDASAQIGDLMKGAKIFQYRHVTQFLGAGANTHLSATLRALP